MPTEAEQVAIATTSLALVNQAAQVRQNIVDGAVVAGVGLLTGFDGWWNPGEVRRAAADLAQLTRLAQEQVGGMAAEYASQAAAVAKQSRTVRAASIGREQPYRRGADPIEVWTRPAEAFRSTFAFTADEQAAFDAALQRTARLIEDDTMMAARDAVAQAYDDLDVGQYRRVLRPELSETGPCGLCVVASDQIYTRGNLMPLHGRCQCETLPINGSVDPGRSLNREDLDRIYAAAGDSTSGEDLKNVRVSVNEHGELGPVLTYRGQRFTGPDDVPTLKRRTAEQNLADLTKLQDTLSTLVARGRSGENVSASTAYVREAISRRAS